MIANQYDFVTWFESLGDASNVALTVKIMEFVEGHAEVIVNEAQRTALEVRRSRNHG